MIETTCSLHMTESFYHCLLKQQWTILASSSILQRRTVSDCINGSLLIHMLRIAQPNFVMGFFYLTESTEKHFYFVKTKNVAKCMNVPNSQCIVSFFLYLPLVRRQRPLGHSEAWPVEMALAPTALGSAFARGSLKGNQG